MQFIKNEPAVILFEGPDNVGKTTQIRMLQEYLWRNYTRVTSNFHFNAMKGLSPGESRSYSFRLYHSLMNWIKYGATHGCNPPSNEIMIFDRSHIGEYVYGPLYRDTPADWIFEIENLHAIHEVNNVFLITLVSDPKILVEREDGDSFSTDLDTKLKEIELFKEATNQSRITNKIFLDIGEATEEQVHKIILYLLKLPSNVLNNVVRSYKFDPNSEKGDWPWIAQ